MTSNILVEISSVFLQHLCTSVRSDIPLNHFPGAAGDPGKSRGHALCLGCRCSEFDGVDHRVHVGELTVRLMYTVPRNTVKSVSTRAPTHQ